MANWRDAYAIQAAVINRGFRVDDEQRKEIDARDISMAKMREILRKDTTVQKAIATPKPEKIEGTYTSANHEILSDRKARYEKGGMEGFGAAVESVVETPVIKNLINALSVGSYSTANFADNTIDALENIEDGNVLGGIGGLVSAPITGLAEGLSASFGGNEEGRTSYSDIIKRVQPKIGIDPEDKDADRFAGIAGFAGDVALDPLTYLTIGIAPAIKGGVKAATLSTGKAAKKIDAAVKEAQAKGVDEATIDTAIRNNPEFQGYSNPVTGFLNGAKDEHKNWRVREAERKAERKDVRRRRKEKATNLESVNLDENVGARPRFTAGNEGVESRFSDAATRDSRSPLVSKNRPEVPETVPTNRGLAIESGTAKYTNDLLDGEEIPVAKEASQDILDATEATPISGLVDAVRDSNVSVAQQLLDTFSKIKPTEPKYNRNQLKKIAELRAARPDKIAQTTNRKKAKVEVQPERDLKASMQSMIETAKSKGVDLKDGKVITVEGYPEKFTVQEVIDNLVDGDKYADEFFDLLPDKWKKYKEAPAADPLAALDEFETELVDNPNRLTPEELEKAGFDPADIATVEDDLRAMTRDIDISRLESNKDTRKKILSYIKSDRISDEELESLRSLTGVQTKPDIATKLGEMLEGAVLDIKKLKAPPKIDHSKGSKESKIAVDDAEIAEVTEALAKNPTAYDLLAGQERLIDNYATAIERARKLPNGDDIVRKSDEVFEAVVAAQTRAGKAGKTNRGFETDTPNLNDGGAWKPDRWNSMSNITLHAELTRAIKSVATGTSKGEKDSAYMNMLYLVDSKFRAAGTQPYMSLVGDIKGGRAGENLSLYDMLSEIPKDLRQRTLFFGGPNATSSIDIVPIMGAVETFVRGRAAKLSDEEIKRKMVNWITSPHRKKGAGTNMAATQRAKAIERLAVNASNETNPKEWRQTVSEVRKTADSFANRLLNPKSSDPDTYQNLQIRKLINSTQHATKVGAFIDDLTKAAVDRLKNARSANDFVEEMRSSLAEIKKHPGLDKENIELAEQAMEAKLAQLLPAVERSVIELTEKTARNATSSPQKLREFIDENAKVGPNGKPVSHSTSSNPSGNSRRSSVATKNSIKAQDEAETQVLQSLADEGVEVENFEVIAATIATDLVRKLHPIQSFFNPRLGISSKGIYRAMNSGLHTVARMQNEFHDTLLRHISRHGPDALNANFKEVQEAARNGMKKNDLSESARELADVIETMFSVSSRNIFAREEVGAAHFNQLMRISGMPLHKEGKYKGDPIWGFDPKKPAGDNSMLWTTWEGIEEFGVMNFLSRMHTVAVRAAQDIAIASSFSRKFGQVSYKPGLVRIVDNNKSNAKDVGMYDLIDPDLYYPKDIAIQLASVDKMMKESRAINADNNFKKFIVNVFDPITNALKASQTTVRPGHWVLSVLGDTLRNQLAGVNTIKPYKDAIAILRVGGREIKDLEPIQKYQRSQGMLDGENVRIANGNGKGVGVFIGGNKKNISYESLYKIFERVVMLPPHRSGGVMEDMLTNEGSREGIGAGIGNLAQKGTEFVTANEKFSLNELAAKRDNWMRTTLAVDFIQKRKWKNVEEMREAVEDFVTQWAPTSTDFTANEAKYGRRSMLYYTWLRGITPRVIETALMKPGVTTIIPKALHGAAVANGLNPESIGDPFPEEGLFPEYYMKNVLGPQWKDQYGMWGINPSSPVIEVLNTFGGIKAGDPMGSAQNIGATAIGMATPFARIPGELAMGTTASGIPIEDSAQYLGDNLGGSWLSTLSRATGKTVGIDGIVERTDSAGKAGDIVDADSDQQNHAQLQLINFLTGLKLTDYQSNSAIKSAAYAEAEKARQEGQRMYRMAGN